MKNFDLYNADPVQLREELHRVNRVNAELVAVLQSLVRYTNKTSDAALALLNYEARVTLGKAQS